MGRLPKTVTPREITLRRSRDNMGIALRNLKIKLKRTPEWDTLERDKLIRKIEYLQIIRVEMKILMNQL